MTATTAVTDRQLELVRFLVRYAAEHHYAPTIREICEALDVASPNAAKGLLDRLAKNGLVTWQPSMSRTLVVTGKGLELVG